MQRAVQLCKLDLVVVTQAACLLQNRTLCDSNRARTWNILEDVCPSAAGGGGKVRLDLDERRYWRFPVKLKAHVRLVIEFTSTPGLILCFLFNLLIVCPYV